MLLNKRCPKCGGNLILGSDYYGSYATCMQCGTSVDVPNPPRRERERFTAAASAFTAEAATHSS